MKIHHKLLCSLVFGLPLLGTSCVSTETVEPDSPKGQESGEVVINIKAPSDGETRADANYKLRYVAKVFDGGNINNLGNLVMRKEIAGSDVSENNVANQIIFKVDPGYSYTILVFADYIPAGNSYTDDAKTMYQDCFYNTSMKFGTTSVPKVVWMRTTPESDAEKLSKDFFFNDNYDCFYGYKSFKKTEDEVVIDMTLERAVALVEFRDISNYTGKYTISIDKKGIGYRPQFNMSPPSITSETIEQSLMFDNSVATTGQDVLSYYVFADDSEGQTISATFTVIPENGEAQKFTVNHIPVKRNYKTVVRGSYLEKKAEETTPPGPDVGKIGDVVLNLSASGDWSGTIGYEMTPL